MNPPPSATTPDQRFSKEIIATLRMARPNSSEVIKETFPLAEFWDPDS
jgi:hypothetical protein